MSDLYRNQLKVYSNIRANSARIDNNCNIYGSLIMGNVVEVTRKEDFPEPISGIINLSPQTCYIIKNNIDLTGDRIVAYGNTLRGISGTLTSLTSTGLTSGALLSSNYTFTCYNLSFSSPTSIYDLDATLNPGSLFVTDYCVHLNSILGTIKGYYLAYSNSCFYNLSYDLIFDGTNASVVYINLTIIAPPAQNFCTLAATSTITTRFEFNNFDMTLQGGIGFNFIAGYTAPVQHIRLFDGIFSGAGSPVSGASTSDLETDFRDNQGLLFHNSTTSALYYMQNNATPTPIPTTTNFYKIEGTTTLAPQSEKFIHTNNRATYAGSISDNFKVSVVARISSAGSNDSIQIAILNASGIHTDSIQEVRTGPSGTPFNVVLQDITYMTNGEFIEVHCKNTSSASNITAVYLHVIVSRI